MGSGFELEIGGLFLVLMVVEVNDPVEELMKVDSRLGWEV